MSAHFLTTERENLTFRIREDQPDWSTYAWNNPGEIIYGPVSSRRLGASLGVNFFPSGKMCSFNCIYCDLDSNSAPELPPVLVPESDLLRKLEHDMLRYFESVEVAPDSITFAGNGEPTLHPAFSDAVQLVRNIRDQYSPEVPICLFTDGAHLQESRVFGSLHMIERVFLKIDGGDEETIERINGKGSWGRTREALAVARSLGNCSSSTMVLAGALGNLSSIGSPEFSELIRDLAPRESFLYTLDYPSCSEDLWATSFDELRHCGMRLCAEMDHSVVVLWRDHPHPGTHRSS